MQILNIKTRKFSFFVIFVTYMLALLTAFLVFNLFKELGLIYSTFLADIAATLVVWLIGILFNNSSIYDPYWSVAPIAILISWIAVLGQPFNLIHLLFLLAIIIWGTRLTLNWAIRWRGLSHQDWRYTQLKESSVKLWFFTNLLGIHIMPTIIVYLALVPVYFALKHTGLVSNLTILGFILCLAAILIQAVSDRQMNQFKADRKKVKWYIDRGLWRYSRHPNYFGEVFFWWGIWVMQAGSSSSAWITIVGPVVMSLLFMFISIPLMERHILETRPGYINYQKRVSMIIPWFRFRESLEQSSDF